MDRRDRFVAQERVAVKPHVAAFWLTTLLLSGMAIQRWRDEASCSAYVYWVSDARMHAGNRVTCGHQYSVSIQTAMDGYNVVCQCR